MRENITNKKKVCQNPFTGFRDIKKKYFWVRRRPKLGLKWPKYRSKRSETPLNRFPMLKNIEKQTKKRQNRSLDCKNMAETSSKIAIFTPGDPL